jgi:hypothetical protein
MRGVEQRVAGHTKAASGWPWARQRLLEGDALVARQHGLARADQAVAVAHGSGHMGDLIAARLACLAESAQTLESLVEERLDVVRLEAPGIGALHLLTDALHAAHVHGVMRQSALFEQILEVARSSAWSRTGSRRRALRAFAIADRLDQRSRSGLPRTGACRARRTPGRPGPARLLELLQQPAIDVALARLLGHQVPQVADLGLADAVDAAEALLQRFGFHGRS